MCVELTARDREDGDVRSVLITGSEGRIGRRLVTRFADEGVEVRGLDLRSGLDLRHLPTVEQTVEGVDVVVHAGALAHDTAGTPDEIIATNLLGTWHVLLAAERAAVGRVVHLSSAQVFGFAEGEGVPESLPVRDSHPLRAARPYGLSKRLAEEMCAAWTSRTGIPTVALRPVLVLDDEDLISTREPDVELGAFVHLDDLAAAVVGAATVALTGHHRLTICSVGPFDTAPARQLLGWSPRHRRPSDRTASR